MRSGRESEATTDKWPAQLPWRRRRLRDITPAERRCMRHPRMLLAVGVSSGPRHVDDSAVTDPVADMTPR